MGKESVIIELNIPLSKPLKKTEKDELLTELISSVESVGGSDIKIKESYYMDRRAAIEPMTLVIMLSAIADTITIFLALRNFLRKKPEYKEFNLKTNSFEITIKGNMSDEEIVKVLREGRKIVETRK